VLIATRENERAAQAFGLNVTRARLTAFALSGFFASLAGGLFVLHQQALGEDAYQPTESIRALSMVVVGGLGSFPGALLGTLFVKSTDWFNNLLPQAVRFLFQSSGSGVGLLFVLLWLRGGLGSVLYRIRDQLLRLVAKRRGLIVPSLIADVLQPEVDVLKQYAAAGGEPTGRLSAASNAPNGTGLLAQAVSRRETRK
jgi:branched-chain amino acid transport system permease protein